MYTFNTYFFVISQYRIIKEEVYQELRQASGDISTQTNSIMDDEEFCSDSQFFSSL